MKQLSIEDFINGLKSQDISILSKAITLVESKNEEHQKLARKLLESLYKTPTKSKRIGISGTPGVGKSTFIEAFGMSLIRKGLKVAVLAIDPTSQKTGGSILGDKTRMQKLSASDMAFIRPSPSGETLGGVAAKTREVMLLCEAFGFDVIIVETVGVGQSEVTVSQMVDFFLLLLQPGSGDDLQGIKRGILEIADLVAINKSDGPSENLAKIAANEYGAAIKILHAHSSAWVPKVINCSAIKGLGIDKVWNIINEYYQLMVQGRELSNKRVDQIKLWLKSMLMDKIQSELMSNKILHQKFEDVQYKLITNKINVIEATDSLFETLTRLGIDND